MTEYPAWTLVEKCLQCGEQSYWAGQVRRRARTSRGMAPGEMDCVKDRVGCVEDWSRIGRGLNEALGPVVFCSC